MTNKTEHPHAWLFRAIADGVPLSEFEAMNAGAERWVDIQDRYVGAIAGCPQAWQVRRKPRTIKIGSRDVPAPPEKTPEMRQKYWLVSGTIADPIDMYWSNTGAEHEWFNAGLVRMSREDAEEVRLALLEVLKGGE